MVLQVSKKTNTKLFYAGVECFCAAAELPQPECKDYIWLVTCKCGSRSYAILSTLVTTCSRAERWLPLGDSSSASPGAETDVLTGWLFLTG